MDPEKKAANPFVYLDIQFDGLKAGRVVIELYNDQVPKTVENFRKLCTGEKGIGKKGKPLHYKGTKFHKVVSMCMVQTGDIINNNGTNGESIYGEYFEDENFSVTHDKEGIVGMVNNGPNTNQSQFYITTQPCFHLDNTNVAFGKVVKGLNILVEMSDQPRENDKPLGELIIADCGEFKADEPWNIKEDDGTEDKYPPWPDDWEEQDPDVPLMEQTLNYIKSSGNFYFNKQDFARAERKYVKCLRYADWYLSKKKQPTLEKSIRLTLMMNLASAKLKRNKYKETAYLCTEVIKDDPDNGKVYYRRAQAMLGLKEYDRALKDLKTALGLHPNDKNIIQLLSSVKKDKLTYLKREKIFFSKLFN
uniref:Peptidyl-prolyl cis-trans isomerase D n=1 Tax=Diabrotica virgifera virgifera TaxID=50390 RepID=A0A6P7G2G2_DIAVI